MALIIITDENGSQSQFNLSDGEASIGRVEGNDIVLSHSEVSGHHAKIELVDGKYWLEDLGSSNGTFIGGQQISRRVLEEGDEIKVGGFSLIFKGEAEEEEEEDTGPSIAAGPGATSATMEVAEEKKVEEPARGGKKPAAKEVKKPAGKAGKVIEFKKKIHELLLDRMDLKRVSIGTGGDEKLREKAKTVVEGILDELAKEIPPGADREKLIKDIMDEAFGLGPLEDLLADETITEVMVNRPDQVYIERKGKIELTDKIFVNNQQILAVIERIVAPIGRRIDESSPMVDGRLSSGPAKGSRVNAIIPPLALSGPTITIRKFSRVPLTSENLIEFGSISKGMVEFLKVCVKARRNIIISGGTGSGKTTLLNILSASLPQDERIVTVEDAAELQLPQDHVVSLEARPPNIEGKGAIPIRQLVRNCLRMRPDRIVVGECRGGEALDMLQAMNTGHDGSLTTVHANAPRDALARLETLVLMAGMELPAKAIREQIASAIHVIVQQSRFPDGTRKVTYLTEVTGMEGDVITLQDIFAFEQTGIGEGGKVEGKFTATGFIPRFVEDLETRGIKVDRSMFKKEGE